MWGVMYYLMKGSIISGNMEYTKIPQEYFKAIESGFNPEEATRIAWEGIDRFKFNYDFISFWTNKLQVAKANRQDIAEELENSELLFSN